MSFSSAITPYTTATDTFTTTGNGATTFSPMPLKHFTISVASTGVVSLWTVVVEGSVDGTNYSVIATHTQALGSGVAVYPGANQSPCFYFRSRCSTLTLGIGTNVIATILGTQ